MNGHQQGAQARRRRKGDKPGQGLSIQLLLLPPCCCNAGSHAAVVREGHMACIHHVFN